MLPKTETFEQFLWRLRTTAHMDLNAIEAPRKKRKKSKVITAVEALSTDRRELLLSLLTDEWSVANDIMYKREGDTWKVRCVGAELAHDVALDGSHCTCEDHKFRKRDCKHMIAMRKVVSGE